MMNTPPLTREQQIRLMERAAEAQVETIMRRQGDPQVNQLVSGATEIGDGVYVHTHSLLFAKRED